MSILLLKGAKLLCIGTREEFTLETDHFVQGGIQKHCGHIRFPFDDGALWGYEYTQRLHKWVKHEIN